VVYNADNCVLLSYYAGIKVKVKEKQSHYRPGQAHGVSADLGSQV
jgi:hypothetical protein